jgi:hypothetical protein
MWEVFLVVLILAVVVNRRRQWGPAQLADPGQTAEMARLREEVDALTAQVLRLQDEQSFMMHLLTSGGGETPAPAGSPDAQAPPPAAQPKDAPTDDDA